MPNPIQASQKVFCLIYMSVVQEALIMPGKNKSSFYNLLRRPWIYAGSYDCCDHILQRRNEAVQLSKGLPQSPVYLPVSVQGVIVDT